MSPAYEKWGATWGQAQILGAVVHVPSIETPLVVCSLRVKLPTDSADEARTAHYA